MFSTLTLLFAAEWRSVRNRARSNSSERRFRQILGSLGAVIFLLIFAGCYRFFNHMLFHLEAAPELGLPLVLRLIEMAHLLFFVMLVISSLSVALSVLYLDKEVQYLVTTPIAHGVIIFERLLITVLRASWFVLACGAPMLLAFAVVTQPPIRVIPIFLLDMTVLAIYVFPPVMIGAIGALMIVRYIPARQAKATLLMLSIMTLSLTVIGIRWMTPEKFLRPKIDPNLGITLSAIATPASPWLPSGWAATAVVFGDPLAWVKLIMFAFTSLIAAQIVAHIVHMRGLDRIATERMPAAGKTPFSNLAVCLLPEKLRLMAKKEILLFWRNPTQWSQLIVLLALVVIYVFNFRQFKGEFTSKSLRDIVSFLNLGMAGFVLVAVANRFVFSSVSMEGRAVWIIRSSPFEMRRMLLAKAVVAFVPLLLLAEAITILSNQAMGVSFDFSIGSALIVGLMTVTLTFLAIGLGALTPRFDLKDPAQIGMSPTGMLYMGLGLAYVAMVVAIISGYLLTTLRERWVGEHNSFTLLLLVVALWAINVCAIVLPWRFGRKKLEEMELL